MAAVGERDLPAPAESLGGAVMVLTIEQRVYELLRVAPATTIELWRHLGAWEYESVRQAVRRLQRRHCIEMHPQPRRHGARWIAAWRVVGEAPCDRRGGARVGDR